MNSVDLFRIYINNFHISVDLNFVVIILLVLIWVIYFFFLRKNSSHFDLFSPEVQLSVPLGGLGSISIKADYSTLQIAYTAWVELITRKAGLLIDEDNDVIADIYSSWYQLFTKMRELIKTVPGPHLQKENTKKLIQLLIGTLNSGLRPHLTKWQAKFNMWYKNELTKDENKDKTPQQIQRGYPEYNELMKDLVLINAQMVDYTNQLHKLVKLEAKK